MSETKGINSNQCTAIKRRGINIEVFPVTGPIIFIFIFISNVIISFFSKPGGVIGMICQSRYLKRNPMFKTE